MLLKETEGFDTWGRFSMRRAYIWGADAFQEADWLGGFGGREAREAREDVATVDARWPRLESAWAVAVVPAGACDVALMPDPMIEGTAVSRRCKLAAV